MGIFASASRAITATFDTVTRVASAADESVSIGTTFISNRAKKMAITDQQSVILSTAQDLKTIKQELDADEELKALFDELAKDW